MIINKEEEYQQLAAYERFQQNRDEYVANKLRLAVEPIEVIDTPDRIAVREALFNVANTVGLEVIHGANDLVSINYLTNGQRTAQAVCRIIIRDTSGDTLGFGTGFLVSPTLLLTNHHVLSTQALAVNGLAEFDYEHDSNGLPKTSKIFQLDPAHFFYSNRDLDFALVAVKPVSIGGAELSQFTYLKMILQSGKVLIDEPVTIIQHPGGKDKRIAMRNNRVLGLADGFIHYETDTEPGSSGSPVVNDQWQLAALHHAGVPRRNSNGDALTKDGHIWQPPMDRSAIDWIANEGVRISAICNHLRAKTDWKPTEREEIKKLLNDGEHENIISINNNSHHSTDSFSTAVHAHTTHQSRQPITLDQFYAMIDDEHTTEAELAPYLQLDIENSAAFAPIYCLNEALILDAEALEGKLVVGWINDWSRRRRQQAYRQKLATGQAIIKIVAEGDSWFQFPVLLDDIIDHLMARNDLAVFCMGAAGDLLTDMVTKAEYMDAIEQEKPDYFLFSGGGNDLVGGGHLAELLHSFQTGRDPEAYLNGRFQTFENKIRRDYLRLFQQLTGRFPTLKIVCHGYDYVIPSGGKSLGKPMETLGITDRVLQQQILKMVIDRMNNCIAEVAKGFANVVYLDLRNTVIDDGWFDELHPRDREFGRIAAKFSTVISPINSMPG